MVKSPCCENKGLKKGPWSPEEDQKLIAYVKEHGHGNWRCLPAKAGLQRCGKSCRLRWINYLKPDIKRGKFSLQEDRTIIQLHALLGNKWSIIAAHLPGRTDNEIKNYWNTHLKKRLLKMGIDPITHKPQTESLGHSHSHHDSAYLRHMAQWESARLEAEARLLRESNSHNHSQNHLGPSSQAQPPRLIVSKIPRRPSLPPCLDILKASKQTSWPSSSSSDHSLLPPTQHNNNTRLYHMYAIMLTNDDHGLESPASTLCFPEANKNKCISNVETGDDKGHGFKQNPLLLQDEDDDIMVAVEAFTSSATTVTENNNNTDNNIAGLSNNVIFHMEGDINDTSSFDPCDEKLLTGESGDEESESMNYWSSLLDFYSGSPAGSPAF